MKIERISKGKYAELFAPERGFTPEEDGYWSRNAMKVGISASLRLIHSVFPVVFMLPRRFRQFFSLSSRAFYVWIFTEVSAAFDRLDYFKCFFFN